MEEELAQLIESNAWHELFQDINRDSSCMAQDYERIEASRPENKGLNRYRDVYPYDHSRVLLENHDATDYINASLVQAPQAKRKYILTQGPLSSTVGHFWLMVWQQNTAAVLMLNRVTEKGQLKCHQYWPNDDGDLMELTDVSLKLEKIHTEPGDHYTVSKLKLTNMVTEDFREISHFHYTTWPDFGVPRCPDTFLEFLGAVRESGALEEEVGPPIVHCSAGIGRSGTFCLVDTCLEMIKEKGAKACRIKDILLDLRSYRGGLIQTAEQLKFSYYAIALGAVNDSLISSSSIKLEILRGENDDSESDDDSAPPPLPPPRSESLKMQQLLQDTLAAAYALNGSHSNGADAQINGQDGVSSSSAEPSPDAPKQKLAVTSSNSSEDQDNATKCILNNHKMEERKREMELRRRKKEEARVGREMKIQEIKRKAKEAEEWQHRKSRMFETFVPFCVGVLMCAVGTYFYMRS